MLDTSELAFRTFICDERTLPWPSRSKGFLNSIGSTVKYLLKLFYYRCFMLGVVKRLLSQNASRRRAFSRFLVGFAAVCIVLVIMSLYTCFFPVRISQWRKTGEISQIRWIITHAVFGHIIILNLAVHFLNGVLRDPGSVPQPLPVEVSRTMCIHCKLPRPLRAHHCSACERCILRMDHHCPWLNNCVGLYTHRHFYLFLVHLWIGIIYLSFAAWSEFSQHARKVCNSTGGLHVTFINRVGCIFFA